MAAEKFGCRPSHMVGLGDPVLALEFDLAAAARLLDGQRAAASTLRGDVEEATDSQRAKNVHW